jgi:hypothetical protein
MRLGHGQLRICRITQRLHLPRWRVSAHAGVYRSCGRNRSKRIYVLLQSTKVAVLRSRSGSNSVPNIEKPFTSTLYRCPFSNKTGAPPTGVCTRYPGSLVKALGATSLGPSRSRSVHIPIISSRGMSRTTTACVSPSKIRNSVSGELYSPSLSTCTVTPSAVRSIASGGRVAQ